jgi:DNA invertase Pin-like site-specific DNA recombinase
MAPQKPVTRQNVRPTCPTCGRPVKIIDLYCRISEDYDGDGGMRSVDDQEADGRISIDELGICCYVIGEVWKDPDKSAWKKKVVRKEFNQLMDRLEGRQADGLWVYDLTRFSRKPKEGERLIEIAESGLIVLSGDSQYDLSTPDGKKQFRDGMTAAAHESDRIQKRVRRGKRLKATKKGLSNAGYRGFAREGFGAEEDQVQREQEIISEVADRILGREPASVAECARDMNERGFRTVRGNLWDALALRRTLLSPALCGLVEYKGEVVPGKRLSGPHALTEEKWGDLKEFFDSRRRGRPVQSYLLTGLVRCGRCGNTLSGRLAPLKPPYVEDGAPRRTYLCLKIKRQRATPVGCAGISIDWRCLDELVRVAVLEKLSDEENADRVAERAAEARGRREELTDRIVARKRLAKDKARKAGLGELDEEEYESWREGHVRLMRDLQGELDGLGMPAAPSMAVGEVHSMWANGTPGQRRGMVQEAFPRLTVMRAAKGRWTDPADRIDWDGVSLPLP